MKTDELHIEIISEEQIEKLERAKELLSEIQSLKESIFGEHKKVN